MADVTTISQNPGNWIHRLRDYIQELQLEMRRVTWPSWKQVRATTIVVIISVFAFSAYFFVVDNIVNAGIQKLFNTFGK